MRYADDLVVMCKSRQQAQAALARLSDLLADLGLEPKAAKTRIVHLQVGGEGFDFLGFHHRLVCSQGRVGSKGVTFLARWPASKAMQHARDRIRELTVRSRLLLPVDWVVEDLNRFLRGWSAYFRVRQLRRPVRRDHPVRPDAVGDHCRQATSPQPRIRLVRGGLCLPEPTRADRSAWNRGRTQTLPGLAGQAECRR